MPAACACPDLQQLRQLLLGRLNGPAADQLEEHLSQCNHCLAAVQTFREEDTFAEAARTPLPADLDGPEGAIMAELMERLSQLRPTFDATPGPESAPPTDPPQPLESTDEGYAFLNPAQAPGEMGWLGPYRILQVLGMGGMGVVFLAEDSQLQRRVALKVMRPALALEGPARQRFLREARTAAAVKHDHVVTIHQVGEERGVPYLAMELLDGEPLDRRLQRQGPLPPADVLHIGREVAEGLAAAHQRGLIHRDLKPSNIWLETRDGGEGRYRVKLIDFGLARSVEDARLTQQGVIVGTPSYMAPEQADGGPVDARCDLFSLGCVLYRLCTGRLPFKGNGNLAALKSLATDQPAPPRTLNPTIPPALDDLVMRLLAKNPADRPATARAVIEALDAIERTPVLPAPVEGTTDLFQAPANEPQPQHPGRGKTRRRWLIAAAAAFLVLAPLTWFYGADVVRFATNKGELVVVADDPNIEVTVNKDGKPTIYDKVKDRRFVLTAGDYEVEVREEGDGGVRFTTKQFTIIRGRKEVLNATLELAKVTPEKKEPGPAQKPEEPRPAEIATADPDRRVAEWVVQSGGFVELNDPGHTQVHAVERIPPQPFKLFTIVLRGEKALGAGLDNLRDLTGLNTLQITDVPLRDEDVERLTAIRGLANLTYITISGTKLRVTDACLGHLKRFANLSTLNLLTPRITDAGLRHLREYPRLKTLYLAGAHVTDKSLEQLRGLDLKGLNIQNSPGVTDAGMENLLQMANLESLALVNTRVGNEGLARLRPLNLQKLDLAGSKVNNAGMSAVAAFKNLYSLTLWELPVTQQGLAELKDLTGLQTLSLGRTKVNDAALVHLQGMKKLSILNLQQTDVTDDGLEYLRGLKLNEVTLVGTRVTTAGVRKLQDALPRCRIYPPALADKDRAVASWVLKLGGTVDVSSSAGRKTGVAGAAELPLGMLRLLAIQVLHGERVKDADLAQLKELSDLAVLTLRSAPVTDAGLAHLAGLTALEELDLVGVPVSDAALAHLGGLAKLRVLVLGSPKITDAGLAHLKPLTQLTQLTLIGSAVTGSGLEQVSNNTLPHLTVLRLRGPQITDAGLVSLKGLPRLTGLSLAWGSVTDAGLEHLQGLNQLQTLDLQGTSVTDAGLKRLEGATGLRQLDLRNTRVSDAGLAHLRRLHQLNILALDSTEVTDTGLEHLEGLTSLTDLRLDGTAVTDAGLKHLKDLSRLTSLTLTNTPVTTQGKEYLKPFMSKCQIAIDPVPTSLDRQVAWHVLGLGGLLRVSEAGKERAIAAKEELPPGAFHVTQIDFNNKNIKDVDLLRLRHGAHLRVLHLGGTGVTDAGLEHLKGLKQLSRLYLEGSRVTPQGRAQLRQELPGCKVSPDD